MSTPPAPARLVVVVATAAPVAVVIRRGPSHWSQLIKWNLEADEFEPGQWLKGVIHEASLSPNGQHIALEVMGGRSRIGSWKDTQYAVVSRVPYFTALHICFGALCYTGASFTSFGELNVSRSKGAEVRALNECPYQLTREYPVYDRERACFEYSYYRPSNKWREAIGRQIELREGQVIESRPEGEHLLFDANLYQPCEVETPDWALRW